MKHLISKKGLSFFLIFFTLFATQKAAAQGADKLSKLDQAIQSGFEALKAKKWSESVKSFEEANKIFDADTEPSEILFTVIEVPDEDGSPPSSANERALLDYRHTMATKQALLQLLSAAYQMSGSTAEAEKYNDAVYRLQGPLWGMSWRVFAPLFYELFDKFVKNEKGENAGLYQYRAALWRLDSGESLPDVFELLKTARANAPKDAAIAGLLANGYLQVKNPKEAKLAAEASLALKPNVKSVLIDLATAEWLLGNFDNSIKHAEAVLKLDADAPGGRMILALNYIEKKEFEKALKEAAAAVEVTNRHSFYLTVQAAALEAAGDTAQAEKILREAWKTLPTEKDLDVWYTNQTLRDLVRKIVKRIEKKS